jgi:hypothetical protein
MWSKLAPLWSKLVFQFQFIDLLIRNVCLKFMLLFKTSIFVVPCAVLWCSSFLHHLFTNADVLLSTSISVRLKYSLEMAIYFLLLPCSGKVFWEVGSPNFVQHWNIWKEEIKKLQCCWALKYLLNGLYTYLSFACFVGPVIENRWRHECFFCTRIIQICSLVSWWR